MNLSEPLGGREPVSLAKLYLAFGFGSYCCLAVPVLVIHFFLHQPVSYIMERLVLGGLVNNLVHVVT